jgi:molybdopterin-binding protein
MHLTLAKDFSGMLSFCNKIEAKVISYENGKLLSSVKLEAEETVLESIITRESFIEMDLKVDEKVAILIKASELSILEVL